MFANGAVIMLVAKPSSSSPSEFIGEALTEVEFDVLNSVFRLDLPGVKLALWPGCC
jgi:hypothetical protein